MGSWSNDSVLSHLGEGDGGNGWKTHSPLAASNRKVVRVRVT